jgi:hypothetical protein
MCCGQYWSKHILLRTRVHMCTGEIIELNRSNAHTHTHIYIYMGMCILVLYRNGQHDAARPFSISNAGK